MDFGKELKRLRQAAGLSQSDVAKKLGYSTPQFISNWERGVSFPPTNALKVIADLYRISHTDLLVELMQEEIKRVIDKYRRKGLRKLSITVDVEELT